MLGTLLGFSSTYVYIINTYYIDEHKNNSYGTHKYDLKNGHAY